MHLHKLVFFCLLICALLLRCSNKSQEFPQPEVVFYFTGDTNGSPFNLTSAEPIIQPLLLTEANPQRMLYITQIGKLELNDSNGAQVRLDTEKILTAEDIRALQGKTITSFYGFSQQMPQFFIKKGNGITWDAIYESEDQKGSEITINTIYPVLHFDKRQIVHQTAGELAKYAVDEVFVAECKGSFKLKKQLFSHVEFNMLLYSMKQK